MSKEVKKVKELFSEVDRRMLIKGFLFDGEYVRFQADDGTMILLKLVKLEQNKDK